MSLEEGEDSQYYEHESGDSQLYNEGDDQGDRAEPPEADSLSSDTTRQIISTLQRENRSAASSSTGLPPGRATQEEVINPLHPRPTSSPFRVASKGTTSPKSRENKYSDSDNQDDARSTHSDSRRSFPHRRNITDRPRSKRADELQRLKIDLHTDLHTSMMHAIRENNTILLNQLGQLQSKPAITVLPQTDHPVPQ